MGVGCSISSRDAPSRGDWEAHSRSRMLHTPSGMWCGMQFGTQFKGEFWDAVREAVSDEVWGAICFGMWCGVQFGVRCGMKLGCGVGHDLGCDSAWDAV